MPIYPYKCDSCEACFDVIKSNHDIDSFETCRSCGKTLDQNNRLIATQSFQNEKVEDTVYDIALGCVVKSSKHRREIAKSRGYEEIGNEPVDNIVKHFDEQRERKAKDNYREFFEPYEVRTR